MLENCIQNIVSFHLRRLTLFFCLLVLCFFGLSFYCVAQTVLKLGLRTRVVLSSEINLPLPELLLSFRFGDESLLPTEWVEPYLLKGFKYILGLMV